MAIERHLAFFNAEGIWGAVIHGIVIAMEEQRALGLPISTEAISGVKVGMMGPLSGIGDTIDWSTLRPLLIALVLPLAENGSLVGRDCSFPYYRHRIIFRGFLFLPFRI